MNHVDRFLRHRIEGRNGLRIRLERTLGNDELRELSGDVYVRTFQSSTLHRTQA